MASSRRKRKARAKAKTAARTTSNVIPFAPQRSAKPSPGRPKAGGEYYAGCGKRKRPVQGIDMGSVQRAQHAGGLYVEHYEEVQNGKRIVTKKRMRVRSECGLNTLHSTSAMGSGDEAKLRMEAAEWLRGLYLKLHPGTSAQPGHGTGYKSLMYGLQRWSDAQIAQFHQIAWVI